jgi:hypothetical protein
MTASASFFENATAQNLRLSTGGGVALGETQFLKKNMLYSEFLIGYGLVAKKGIELSLSAGLSGVSFDYYDQSFNSVYNDRTFITIPMIIRKYNDSNNSGRISFCYGIGVSGSWSLKDRKKIKTSQSSVTSVENYTGFNFCISTELGVNYKINKSSFFTLSLKPQVDIFTNYSDNLNKIEIIKNMIDLAYVVSLRNLK